MGFRGIGLVGVVEVGNGNRWRVINSSIARDRKDLECAAPRVFRRPARCNRRVGVGFPSLARDDEVFNPDQRRISVAEHDRLRLDRRPRGGVDRHDRTRSALLQSQRDGRDGRLSIDEEDDILLRGPLTRPDDRGGVDHLLRRIEPGSSGLGTVAGVKHGAARRHRDGVGHQQIVEPGERRGNRVRRHVDPAQVDDDFRRVLQSLEIGLHGDVQRPGVRQRPARTEIEDQGFIGASTDLLDGGDSRSGYARVRSIDPRHWIVKGCEHGVDRVCKALVAGGRLHCRPRVGERAVPVAIGQRHAGMCEFRGHPDASQGSETLGRYIGRRGNRTNTHQRDENRCCGDVPAHGSSSLY